MRSPLYSRWRGARFGDGRAHHGIATEARLKSRPTVTILRRLAYVALVLAFAQIVFGAIVRITGSGMGCGDHWPRCMGHFFPPLDRPDLIIEVTHRYLAAAVTIGIIALLGASYAHRAERGVGGEGGVLRAAALAFGLVVVAAVFGGMTVKLSLNPYVIVTHLAIAMTLLAVLSVAVLRAGGWGFDATVVASARTFRSARAAAVLTFLVLVLGALTANVAGANVSCQGFPWCTTVAVRGGPLHIQITHRVLAFLLLFHTFGIIMALRRRGESPLIKRIARLAFAVVLLQLLVAAMLVETHLPPVWRSLHQAVGTLVWLTIFTFAALAKYASREQSVAGTSPAGAWT